MTKRYKVCVELTEYEAQSTFFAVSNYTPKESDGRKRLAAQARAGRKLEAAMWATRRWREREERGSAA